MSQMKLKEPKTMAGRRGNNEGSIFPRKDKEGKVLRWCGMVITGYKTDGTPIRKTLYGKTRTEVARKVSEMVSEVNKTGYTTVSARDERNFKILMSEWFGMYGTVNMSSRTEFNRRGTLDKQVYEKFGKFNVQDINTNMLQRFFNAKDKELCSDSVSKIRGLLNRFFAYALKQGFIKENPMLGLVKRKRDTVMDDDEMKALRPEIRQQVFSFVMEHKLLDYCCQEYFKYFLH